MDLKTLTDHELLSLKQKTEDDINRFNIIQQTRKIQLNSAYGALGTKYFRYFDVDIAESVTLSGRMVYAWMAEAINTKLNSILKTQAIDYIVAADTDSWMIRLGEVVNKAFVNKPDASVSDKVDFVDKCCDQIIGKLFTEKSQELAEYTNARKNAMSVKREAIADKGLWSIKKRYALSLYALEGERFLTPKIKLVGGDVVKSSTPPICKKALRDVVEIILSKDENAVHEYVKQFRNKFMSSKVEDITTTLSTSSLNYMLPNGQFKLGAPFQSKGAIVYNNLIKSLHLESKYSMIYEGDKVSVVSLKPKNPINSDWIAFPDRLPKEFNLQKYIDYDKAFEKNFLTPVMGYLGVINWTAEKVYNIESLFV